VEGIRGAREVTTGHNLQNLLPRCTADEATASITHRVVRTRRNETRFSLSHKALRGRDASLFIVRARFIRADCAASVLRPARFARQSRSPRAICERKKKKRKEILENRRRSFNERPRSPARIKATRARARARARFKRCAKLNNARSLDLTIWIQSIARPRQRGS